MAEDAEGSQASQTCVESQGVSAKVAHLQILRRPPASPPSATRLRQPQDDNRVWRLFQLDARTPRNKPATLKSSSSSGQLMYSPSPIRRRFARSAADAWSKRRKHANGTI